MATITYKCPNCDGGLRFDPNTQKYKCDYCLSEFSVQMMEELKKEGQPETAPDKPAKAAETARAGTSTFDGAVLYQCPSCGAQIVTESTTAASFCYYCHNPVVLEGRLAGAMHPDYVIPFAFDKQEAIRRFEQWISRKKYVPKDFYSPQQIETMTGVYFPYWLYSSQIEGELTGEGKKIRTWEAAGLRYTETKVYQVHRQGRMKLSYVVRNALKKANKKLAEGVQPFNFEEIKAFNMGFLSGFMAENRDIEKQEFEAEVEQEVKQYAAESLKAEVAAYHSLTIREQKTQLRDASWQLALLPVWTMTYQSQQDGRIYYFALNGQTGKSCGELPVDERRLGMLFVQIFIPLLILLLIAGYIL